MELAAVKATESGTRAQYNKCPRRGQQVGAVPAVQGALRAAGALLGAGRGAGRPEGGCGAERRRVCAVRAPHACGARRLRAVPGERVLGGCCASALFCHCCLVHCMLCSCKGMPVSDRIGGSCRVVAALPITSAVKVKRSVVHHGVRLRQTWAEFSAQLSESAHVCS